MTFCFVSNAIIMGNEIEVGVKTSTLCSTFNLFCFSSFFNSVVLSEITLLLWDI